MNNYELKTEKFTGPIEKLLEIIEEKKMPITDLSLAEVTADFLNYLKTIESVEPRLLADFIVVASRLLLIKSKSLLPDLELTEEEETGIKDLEERLKLYQTFKPAINLFKKVWEQKGYSVSRPLFHGRPPVFYPPNDLSVEILRKSAELIFEALRQLEPEVLIIESSIISLEEKIKEVVNRLEKGLQQFGELAKEKSRSEVIILFLALLHLLRDQIIRAEQNQGFSEITITKRENGLF